MTILPASTPAELVDRAVQRLLDGEPSGMTAVDPAIRPALAAAVRIHAALAPIPISRRFETRLGARLAERGLIARGVRAVGDLTRRELAGRGRLLAGAAVSSAAVGVSITALAIWRTRGRAGNRLLHR